MIVKSLFLNVSRVFSSESYNITTIAKVDILTYRCGDGDKYLKFTHTHTYKPCRQKMFDLDGKKR